MNTQFRHHKLSADDESRLVYVKPVSVADLPEVRGAGIGDEPVSGFGGARGCRG